MQRSTAWIWVAVGLVSATMIVFMVSARRGDVPAPDAAAVSRSNAGGGAVSERGDFVVQPGASAPRLPRAIVERAAPEVRVATSGSETGAIETVPSPKTSVAHVTREAAEQAVDHVQLALRDFRTSIGSNPVGTNAEITSALLGDNVKQVRLEIPAGSNVNGQGELCDPWGTPYFFHQQSAQRMEVRSAGPDQRMWTADDIQM